MLESTDPRPSASRAAPDVPEPVRLILAGAPAHHDNRGVEALGSSVVDHLAATPTVGRVSILDDGWGVRPSPEQARYGAEVELVGARHSRRWYRRESWARVRVDQRLGGLGNPVVERLGSADAVLDLSGGDSFTDLYGRERLTTVSAPKEAALRQGRPLVLLPQTFGPFTTTAGRRRAERIVRASSLAYSRDEWSHEQLLTLAGPDADTTLLRRGVDVAFGLRAREPEPRIVDQVRGFDGELLVGVNVSGLLRTREEQQRFGLAGDYLATVTALVEALVAADAVVMLVAHVHGDPRGETDAASIALVMDRLAPATRARVWALAPHLRAAELKWCIARTAWFAGSRMHATIAALSSAVPAFGYAYSDKTAGVFGTCGVADHVTDARAVAGEEAVDRAMASFAAREQAQAVLDARVPAVVSRARGQLDDVLATVAAWRRSPAPVGVVA